MKYIAEEDQWLEAIKDLPEKEFIATRRAILDLLTDLFPKRSMKWKSEDIPKNLIDITTYEIAKIWTTLESGGEK